MHLERLRVGGLIADGEDQSGGEPDEFAQGGGGEQIHVVQGHDPVVQGERLEIARAGWERTEGSRTWIEDGPAHAQVNFDICMEKA